MTKDANHPKIANIVATGSFSKNLDIEWLYKILDLPEMVFDPETYPALLVKIFVDGNKRHVTLYRNGKYIIAGATSEADMEKTYREIKKKLKSVGAL